MVSIEKEPLQSHSKMNKSKHSQPSSSSPKKEFNNSKKRRDHDTNNHQHPHKKSKNNGNSNTNNSLLKQKAHQLLKERQSLPIFPAKQTIIEHVKNNDTVVIVGETGSGKTTQIPQYLSEAGFTNNGIIGITQPRRVAAISIAKRVAEEDGSTLGSKIGYSVRFQPMYTNATKLKYLTDGMLLREVLADPLLSRYSVIVLDEAHERTVRTDVVMGMVKRIQKVRNGVKNANNEDTKKKSFSYHGEDPKKQQHLQQPDDPIDSFTNDPTKDTLTISNKTYSKKSIQQMGPLKVLVMSATLDAEKFAAFYNDASILYIEGRTHPIRVFHTAEPQEDYIDAALTTILTIHKTQPLPGDVLVFLSGQEEIESLQKLITEHLGSSTYQNVHKLWVLPLFASLPSKEQQKVFSPTPPSTRKIILSTNIAETSVTIPGIRHVIDTGVIKLRGYNSKTGIETLQIHAISKAGARQRMGRAGREAPGNCYRLYTEKSFEELEGETEPEIRRCNLASVVLMLKAAGVEDVVNFDFMERPPRAGLLRALEQLYALQALDDSGRLTPLGTRMSKLPLDPPYAKILLSSLQDTYLCPNEIISIISMLSIENVFLSNMETREDAGLKKRRFAAAGNCPLGEVGSGDLSLLLGVFKGFVEVLLRCSNGNNKESETIEVKQKKKVVDIDDVEDGVVNSTDVLSDEDEDVTALMKNRGKNNHTPTSASATTSTSAKSLESQYLISIPAKVPKGVLRWCQENHVSLRGLKSVLDIRNQLCQYLISSVETLRDNSVAKTNSAKNHITDPTDLAAKLSIEALLEEVDQDLHERVAKCFLTGFFTNTAIQLPDSSFKTVVGNQQVYIHPSSTLFGSAKGVKCVMYNELVLTSRQYLRGVSVIRSEWLADVAPKYYGRVQ